MKGRNQAHDRTEQKLGFEILIPLLTFLAVYLAPASCFPDGTENPFKQISREFAVLCGLTTVILLSRSRKNID